MPFDGDPKKYETKPEVFSLRGLIAWLETQDPATEYNYANCRGGCLIGRYLHYCGIEYSPKTYGDFLEDMQRVRIAGYGEWTYGAALKRARRLLAELSR